MDNQNIVKPEQCEEENMQIARDLIIKYRNKISEVENELQSVNNKNAAKEEALSLKSEPYYDDIDEVLTDVLNYASAHNTSSKEAYNALYGEGKAKKIISKNDKDSKNIAALSSEGNKSGEPEEGVLSGEELWTAKKAGMSLADYLKYKMKG